MRILESNDYESLELDLNNLVEKVNQNNGGLSNNPNEVMKTISKDKKMSNITLQVSKKSLSSVDMKTIYLNKRKNESVYNKINTSNSKLYDTNTLINLSTITYKPNKDENSQTDEDGVYDNSDFDFNIKLITSKLCYLKEKLSENERKNDLEYLYYFRINEKYINNTQIYYSDKFFDIIYHISKNYDLNNEIIEEYHGHLAKIKVFIDDLIQLLIEKSEYVPYNIKLICKVINESCVLKGKSISILERLIMIGEFFFGRIIIPVFITSDYSLITTSTNIISYSLRRKFLIISKILKKLYRFELFESNIDPSFTPLNSFLSVASLKLKVLYEKLIDVQLIQPIDNIISNINPTMIQNNNDSIILNVNGLDYFKLLPEQLLFFKSICFSIDDILTFIGVYKSNKDIFKSNEKLMPLYKSYQKLEFQEDFLRNQSKKFMNQNIICHFLIFKHDNNPNFNHILTKKVEIFKCSDELNISSIQNKAFLLNQIKFCINLILRQLNLLNSKTYPFLSKSSDTILFFEGLDEIVQMDDLNNNLDKIPLKWYSTYLTSNLNQLEIEYKSNNFHKLYEVLMDDVLCEKLQTQLKTNSIIAGFGLNTTCGLKKIEIIKKDKQKIVNIEKQLRVEKFILTFELNFCIRYSNFFNKTDGSPWIIMKTSECIHNKRKSNIFLAEVDFFKDLFGKGNLKVHHEEHGKTINDFIKIISKVNEVQFDIYNGSNKSQIYSSICNFFEIIHQYVIVDNLFKGFSIEEISECIQLIEKFIYEKLYIMLFPSIPSKNDNNFLKQCWGVSWVTTKMLGVDSKYVNESLWDIPKSHLCKLSLEKCPQAILNRVNKVYTIINNTIIFSSGKKDSAGADDIVPIMIYLLIKSKPERIFSYLNFAKALINPKKLMESYGFLMTQMELCINFILNLNNGVLKIDEKEFISKFNYHVKLFERGYSSKIGSSKLSRIPLKLSK